MARLIRILFSMMISAFAARIVENLMAPKGKTPLEPNAKQKPLPTVDLKPCPVCGVYTAQPASHCNKQSA